MAVDISSLLGSGGQSSIDQLVSMYMAVERKPIDSLKAKRDQLDVRSSLFNDLRTKINDLKSAADDLSTATGSVFTSHTTTSSDSAYATGTAWSSAANGTYLLDSIVLAKAHRLQSTLQASNWTAGGTGSFVLNGALVSVSSGATLSDLRNAINSASYAPGKGVVATIINVDSTHSRLVLDAKSTGGANAIKMADLSGSILLDFGIATTTPAPALTGVTATASASDPAHPEARLTDGSAGDARAWYGDPAATSWSVTLDLGSSRPVSRLEWGRDQGGTMTGGTPKSYTLEYSNDGGTTWTALKTVANNSFPAGGTQQDSFSGVTANKLRMTITSTVDGTAPAIDEMKLYDDSTAGSILAGAELQQASDASLKVNGVEVKDQPSNNISDAVSGLTLQLNKAGGPVTLTVAGDTPAMNTKVTAFLDKLNALTDYLRSKSAVTKEAGNNYTRGPLNGHALYTGLNDTLAADLARTVSTLPMGSPARLVDLGVQMDAKLHFIVKDSAKLSSWLANNPSGVAALFGGDTGIAKMVSNHLSPYVTTPVEGSKAYLDREQELIRSQQSSIDTQTRTLNERLAMREQLLRSQFTRMQAAMIQEYQLQQQMSSVFSYYTASY